VNTEFSEGNHQVFAQGQPEQESGLSGYIAAVSQPIGTEMESKPLRRGSVRKQEKASTSPLEGPAGVMPEYVDAGGESVVVRDEENSLQGEGTQELSRNSTVGDNRLAEACQIWVPDMQKRLAQIATLNPNRRFGNLYGLLTWDKVLDEAADRLLGNKGSRTPGLDGMQRDALVRNRGYHLKILQEQLKSGTFKPMPVKRVYIPKKNGKMRPLGIPTLYDRWVQMALKIILEPIFESDFAEFSHGFRPRRSCHTAIAHIHRLTIQPRRKVYWVIEGDIKGFFDHVHHKKLMSLLKRRLHDQRLSMLIWKFLRAGVMEGKLFTRTTEGTPQGGVLSPLLANIYLNHFDQWFAEQAMLGDSHARDRNRKAGHANFMMVRYADDFVVFSNGTKQETEAFKTKMKEWLAEEMKLELSEEKTAITHFTEGFNFLGFTTKKTIAQKRAAGGKEREVVVSYPSTESVERAIRKITEMTDRDTTIHSHTDQIEALNAFLRGWGEYFRHTTAKSALRYVGSHAHMRMWKWLVAKDEERHGWRSTKAKYYRDNTWVAGGKKLIILQEMKIEYLHYVKIKNPYLGLHGLKVEETKHLDPFDVHWHGSRSYGNEARGGGPAWRTAREEALAKTEGTCAICGSLEQVEVHHIKAKTKRGGNVEQNLIPLCRKCHRQAEKRNSVVSQQLREKVTELNSGEPDALKGASPVRGETL
jgi:RNA-directed DNA polymerase